MKLINAIGIDCPMPVIETKKALKNADEVTIIVDNNEAVENIKNFARNNSCQVAVVEDESNFKLIVKRVKVSSSEENNFLGCDNNIIVIKSELFGEGDPELGKILMKGYFASVLENSSKVSKIYFLNTGVKLTTVVDDVVEVIKDINDRGVDIASCGLCLDYYELKENLKVGRITNMYEIVENMLSDKNSVITV